MAHCVGSSDVRPNIICIRSFSFGADKDKMILFFTCDEKSYKEITIISMKK